MTQGRDGRRHRHILGIQSFANANSGACLIRHSEDGAELEVVAISEERLVRRKHPYSFPVHALAYCLEVFGLSSLDEVDLLVGDFIREKRWHRSGPAYFCTEFDYLKTKLAVPPEKIVQISHHMAHAASAFYPSGFDSAAILIVDGNGSGLETTSFLEADGGGIRYLDSYRARGIGALYAAVTNWILGLGDGGDGGEGKTMGLAPYGADQPRVLDFQAVYDGIRTDYSAFMRRLPYYDVLNHVDPVHRVYPLHGDHRLCDDRARVTEPYFARAAFDVQLEAERAFVHLGRELHRRTGGRDLCVAGGVALNSVANKIMFDATDFERMFVFPACSDAGIPFGLALWGYHNARELGDFPRRRLSFRNAYLGRDYPQAEIDAVLQRHGIAAERVTPRQVAQRIADGQVVGWFQGASEYGPRALGHRSILADSRRAEMKDIVNIRVKHRKTYRPFAPAVLREDCDDHFELEGESPYMLLVARVKRPELLPAITHVDGTARVQTVTRADNGVFYDLIAAFKEITGVPVILNTSFNDAGEPIVETPEDALICFLSTEMDCLILGDRLVEAGAHHGALVTRLREERDARIAAREATAIDRFFPGYDPDARDRYIAAENRKAVRHVRQSWKDRLHALAQAWIERETRVLLVGTPDHAAFVARHAPALGRVSVAGFAPFGERLDEPLRDGEGAPAVAFASHAWPVEGDGDYDEILIVSHEYMFEIAAVLHADGVAKPVHEIYDTASRNPMLIERAARAGARATA